MQAYLPVLTMMIVAVLFSLTFLGLSALLGPKKPTESKLSVYECGSPSQGSARERFSVKFYLVAILFILFDIEVVFMYPWAVTFKKFIASGNGPFEALAMGTFFILLTVGLIYEFKKGALNWSGSKSDKSAN